MLVSTRKDPLIGRILKGVYRIDELLAEGSMSHVYRAEHMDTKAQVVIKTLRPWFNDVDYISSFLRSADLYGQIKHPNVVGVFDSGRLDDLVYVAMDYMNGSALSDIVSNKGLSLTNILWIMEQICTGVDAAHKLNILHRDIKPSNIIASELSSDTKVAKVLDFCIGRPLTDENIENTHNGMAMGLPGFISPEQISGERDLDVRTDVYALGAVLYYMVAGKTPYGDINPDTVLQKQLSLPPDRLLVIQLADPNTWKLQTVILKAMKVDRNERYPSVMALWQDILKQLNIEPPHKITENARSQPNPTKYMFIFKGELEEGTDANKAKTDLQTILKLNSHKIEKLFTKERVVIRNNISYEDAKRFSNLFKIAGAIGYIEKIGDDTHNEKQKVDTTEETFSSSSPANETSLNPAQDNPQLEHSTQAPSLKESISCESASAESALSKTVSSEVISPAPASTPLALAQPAAAEANLTESPLTESLLPETESAERTLVKTKETHEKSSHDDTAVTKITQLNVKKARPEESQLPGAESPQAVLAETDVVRASPVHSNLTESNTAEASLNEAPSTESRKPGAKPALAVSAEAEALQPSATHTDLTEANASGTNLNEALPEKPDAESSQAVLAESEIVQVSPSKNAGSTQSSIPQYNSIQARMEVPNPPQNHSMSANAIQLTSIQQGKYKKNSSPTSKSIHHKQSPKINVSSLSFHSSSFAVAGVEQESLGEKPIDHMPSVSKYYIYTLAVIVLLTSIGFAWSTPVLRSLVKSLTNLL